MIYRIYSGSKLNYEIIVLNLPSFLINAVNATRQLKRKICRKNWRKSVVRFPVLRSRKMSKGIEVSTSKHYSWNMPTFCTWIPHVTSCKSPFYVSLPAKSVIYLVTSVSIIDLSSIHTVRYSSRGVITSTNLHKPICCRVTSTDSHILNLMNKLRFRNIKELMKIINVGAFDYLFCSFCKICIA